MPQDNPRTDNPRTDSMRSESPRAERFRERAASTPNMMSATFGEIGVRNVKAGLRMQKEMFDVLHDIGRDWFARATSEAELAFQLPNKLTGAGSVPDALSAYQEWLGELVNALGEDSRRFISDSQKIVDTGVRCFADASPIAPN